MNRQNGTRPQAQPHTVGELVAGAPPVGRGSGHRPLPGSCGSLSGSQPLVKCLKAIGNQVIQCFGVPSSLISFSCCKWKTPTEMPI